MARKYLISDYTWRLAPVPRGWSYYFAQTWVRDHGPRLEESEFFEVFGPPPAVP